MKGFAHKIKLTLAGLALLAAALGAAYSACCLLWFLKFQYQKHFLPQTIARGFVRHPFLTSEMAPNQRMVEYPFGKEKPYKWITNAQGCRDERNYTTNRTPGVARWLCLGGSAVVCGTANSLVVPAQLERLIDGKSAAGTKTEIYNFGRVGWDSTQELLAFATVLRDYRPDYLLIYNGRNDALMASLPRYRPFWNAWSYEVDRELNEISAARMFFYPLWRAREAWRQFRNPDEYAAREAHLFIQEKGVKNLGFYRAHPEIGPVYQGNLERLVFLARQGGCKGVLMVLQPQFAWSGKPPSPGEKAFDERHTQTSWREAMMQLRPVIRAAHENAFAAVRTVLPCVRVDLNAVFAGETRHLFVDDCHLTDDGNAFAAENLAPLALKLMGDSR
ncbi:MAG: SGNH/GDSL hydrolase family protein [Verrucomicrobiae bacterium]|nr:SGNH/GDSL hydrolase family protein [Verrucomicrobiae bacterium]